MAGGKPIIGIDLGTTNSVAAVLEGGRPVIIPNLEGDRLTPSVVAFTDGGEVLVGELAKRQAVANPRRTIHSVKRFIGRRFREIRSGEKLLAFEVTGGRRGYAKIRVDGRDFTPQEISAYLLRRIKRDAEAHLSCPVERAVVTVPAYFNDAQRQATKDAGEIAGLVVERIINEPTAAALSYGLDRQDAATIAVLDLGGGTFDVTILRVERGVFRILATSGDTHLGGDDFDRAILREVAEQFQTEHGVDPRQQPESLQRLLEACERAKRELSAKETSDITLPFLAADDQGPRHLRREITRIEFERLAHPLFERCAFPICKALDDAGLTPSDVQEIVLSGGGTRMPRFVELAQQIFGREPRRGVHPEEAVALGAAIQAGISSGERRDLVLMDVTPFSLGIETSGGFMSRIIERNTTIPVRQTEVFSTSEDNQSIVILRVYQGEHELASHNRLLDEFNLEGIRPARRGEPRIEVSFDIDASGILHVGAEDLDTGCRQTVRITDSSGLSRDEIERLRLQLEPPAASGESGIADELRRYGESLCVELENALQRAADAIGHDTAAGVQRLIDNARRRLGKSSIAELKETAAALAQAGANVARWTRANAPHHEPDARDPTGDGSSPNDDVVEVRVELS